MSPDALDTIAGRYVLEEPIARGGMATVWKARDEVLARFVALKVLSPELAGDESFLTRFRTEALAAGRLSHPNIVQTFDTGEDENGNHFMVMEYCAGGTLEELMKKEGALPPERAVELAAHICDALAYAHRHGVVHRDIKPGNVLLGADGSVKVGDFGIAKAAFASQDVTTTGKILGTVSYLSPEQARGDEPDGRSDLYSLGVVLFKLLTGRLPFEADSAVATAMHHLKTEPPAPRAVRGGIPRALDTVVLKALAKDPDARFATADDMRRALEAACAPSRTVAFDSPRRDADVDAAAPAEPGIGRVLALIAAVVVAALLVAYVVGEERPLGGGGAEEDEPAAAPAKIVSVQDFDPHGGGSEHPEDAPLAADDDPATAWETEDYEATLSLLKPGVGLLFDLGREAAPAEIEIVSLPEGADIELRVGNSVGSSEDAYELVASEKAVPETLVIDPDGAAGRYWLIWITDLPGGGGGSAGIAEVRFLR